MTTRGMGRPEAVGPTVRPWRQRTIEVEELDPDRLQRAKRAFSTRRVSRSRMRWLLRGALRPRPGDLVLARIHRLGNHRRIESPEGRRMRLFVGDEIVVAYANRYASDQFESYVPHDLGPTQLVASGGVASSVETKSADVRRATDIVPIGLVSEDGATPLNLDRFGLGEISRPDRPPPTIAVIGTSMNAGKTTTINQLVRGLVVAGHRPGVTKVTGTGSGNDYWQMLDAGARAMIDFTDAGLASTFLSDLSTVEWTAATLIDHLGYRGCGAILVEVADGLMQRETAHLVDSATFRERVDGVVFAAGDSLGAVAGVARLRHLEIPVLAVAGRLTRSPLAVAEAARVVGAPILSLEDLADPRRASQLLGLTYDEPDPVDSTSPNDTEGRDVVVDLRRPVQLSDLTGSHRRAPSSA